MKDFTKTRLLNLSVCLILFVTMLASSCTSPQHFSFSAAPPAYQKEKKEIPTPAVPLATENALTTSVTDAPVVLPEIASLKETKAPQATAQPVTQKNEVNAKQKLTLTQKVVLKKLQKQVSKLDRKTQKIKETAEGPVTTRNAIGIIIIGLVVAIVGGFISGLLSSLGGLIVLVGLILLILNYI